MREKRTDRSDRRGFTVVKRWLICKRIGQGECVLKRQGINHRGRRQGASESTRGHTSGRRVAPSLSRSIRQSARARARLRSRSRSWTGKYKSGSIERRKLIVDLPPHDFSKACLSRHLPIIHSYSPYKNSTRLGGVPFIHPRWNQFRKWYKCARGRNIEVVLHSPINLGRPWKKFDSIKWRGEGVEMHAIVHRRPG